MIFFKIEYERFFFFFVKNECETSFLDFIDIIHFV